MHDGGVDLVEVDRILRDVVAEIIGFPVGRPSLHASTCHPHAEIAGMMVSSVVFTGKLALAIHGTSEFTTEDDQGILEEAALLEVLDEGRSRLVDVHALALYQFG